jgi:hypothetical protein
MIHLNVDPFAQNIRWFGQVSRDLAILALPTVTYQDLWLLSSPQSISSTRLCGAFFQAVSDRYEGVASPTLEGCRTLLIEAGREAIEKFPEAAAKGVGSLLYSVVFRQRQQDHWVVFNMGSNVVLRVTNGEVSRPVIPHSPIYETDGGSLVEAASMDFGTCSTVALEPDFEYEEEIRGAELKLNLGDWLVITPGTSAAFYLRTEKQPENLQELEEHIIRKMAGNLRRPPAWIAVSAE